MGKTTKAKTGAVAAAPAKGEKKSRGWGADQVLDDVLTESLIPTEDCPRRIDEKSEKFQELLESIKASGVQVRVIVRPHPEKKGKYDLRAGKRRLRACQILKLKTVPAIICHGMTDAEAFEVTFAENKGREDLTALEEGELVRQGLERYKGDVTAIAASLGWSPRKVRLAAQLQNLDESWRKAIATGNGFVGWTAAHFGLIARYSKARQKEILRDGLGWELRYNCPSVARLERFLAEGEKGLRSAKFDVYDCHLISDASSCLECKSRSSCQPGLFDEQETDPGTDAPGQPVIPVGDRCLDKKCWDKKLAVYLHAREANLRKQENNKLLLISEEYGHDRPAGSVHAHDVKPSKKGAKGAVLALVVDGKGAGSERYVQLEEHVQPKKAAGGKTLKEKQEQLARRRNEWILEQVKEMLADEKHPAGVGKLSTRENLDVLLRLALTFGAHPFTGRRDETSCYSDVMAIPERQLQESLWAGVREAMTEKYSSIHPLTLDDPLDLVCQACGIDHQALVAEAEKRHPTPKAWALHSMKITNTKPSLAKASAIDADEQEEAIEVEVPVAKEA